MKQSIEHVEMNRVDALTTEAALAVLKELRGRRGFDHLIDGLDEETRSEITRAIAGIVSTVHSVSPVEQPAAVPKSNDHYEVDHGTHIECVPFYNPDYASAPADERGIFDGDSEDTRTAFRAYDQLEPVSRRTPWQIWRDACAWHARAATASATFPSVEG
ncbi:hypothetical protein BGV57_03220 [Burkholderia ubonensis]|uniref:hypothetical protein n=1 Tax=Burkholderia ubonensis TaxID=101571 RepID=UPI0008FE13C7|nr:hypothetical protein [Burkholderia ubonensis]OJB45898.1 hypothetical protein BGV57_03220 [Burkholderia ubonensis]